MLDLPPPPPILAPDRAALLRAIGSRFDRFDLEGMAGFAAREASARHVEALAGLAAGHAGHWFDAQDVLEAMRWMEPGAERDATYRESAHLRRAFACAALLQAVDPPEITLLWGQNRTLIRLIASLRALRLPVDREAAAFLVWLMPQLPRGEEAEEGPFYALALLWFALALDLPDAALTGLIDWVMACEDAVARHRRATLGVTPGEPWLLAGATRPDDLATWRELGLWLPERLRPAHGAAVRDGLLLISAALAP